MMQAYADYFDTLRPSVSDVSYFLEDRVMKYQRSNRAASSVPKRMRYGILLHAVALLAIAGLGHASAGLGPDELDAQLRATQRSNLIEMGIILAISLSGMVAVAWYMRRKLAAAPRADRADAEDP